MDLLDTFRHLNAKAIQDYVTDRRQEDLQLEFKTISDPELKKREDRKNLAIALSGFANSDGGIVVWGVKAKKDEDNIDCAQSLELITDVNRFLSKLNELTGKAVRPLVDGIDHKIFPIKGTQGAAATIVPTSDRGPHMAKLGEDRYYKRNGDSFYKLEHFDLEDMFGRRPAPALRVTTRPLTTRREGGSTRLVVLVSLLNQGRGAAIAPYLSIEPRPQWKLETYGGMFVSWARLEYYFTIRDNTRYHHFSGGQDAVLQPGVDRELCRFSLTEDRFKASEGPLELHYDAGSIYSRPTRGVTIVERSEIETLL